VGFFTTNPTKLCLHFSDFFYDFLRNLQESAKALYYLRSAFTTRPLTGFPDLRTGPWFTKIFLERMGSPQLGPRAPAGGGLAGFRRLRRGFGRGSWGKDVGAHHCSIWGRGRGGTASGGGGLRLPAAVAAGALAPARLGLGQRIGWLGQLW
jgi:hypothetical protein